YDEAFAVLDEIETPYVPPETTHAYTSYLIRLRPAAKIGRDDLLRAMADRGVSCRVGIQPLHWEPIYRERFGRLPETEDAARSTMFLPIYPGLTEAQQNHVIDALKHTLAGRLA